MAEFKVVKRDGRLVGYNKEKIVDAIENAVISTTPEKSGVLSTKAGKIIDEWITEIKEVSNEITVEEIQEIVEDTLMKLDREVAKAYIRYRNKRTEMRHQVNKLDTKINELVEMNEDVVRENANKNAQVFNTKRDLLAGVVSRDFAERYLLPTRVREAHNRGDIHFHDLDYSPMFEIYNCMLIDFKNMFENGFTVGNADIETPKSIKTATALLAQIVANVSSNIYGGTTANNIDLLLEPYAEKSYAKHLERAKEYGIPNEEEYAKEVTKKEIYDSMQSLEYEINTLYNSNGQTPFFTVGFGLGTSWVCREIQKSILEIRIKGLGKSEKTAVFPKLIFVLKDGLNLKPEDPNYDIKELALECSVKRMYPDILSYDRVVDLMGDFKFPMGCRSFLPAWQNEDGEYINEGRNNMGVVTINLPRISLETETTEEFFKVLDNKLDIVREALDFRIKRLDNVRAKNAPILYQHGAMGVRKGANDLVSDIFKNTRATASLGYIGIHEAVTKFYGSDWHDNEEAKEFSINIMKYLNKKAAEWKAENGYGYSVYGTPAESLCYRFAELDKERFGSIEGVTDKEYYTNSFHVDVRKNMNPFDKILFEKEYAKYSSGGFIHYVEMANLNHNKEALESFWDFAYQHVGYYGVNTPIDVCYKCNYEGEFELIEDGFKCPNCGNDDPSKSSCIRRLCGYLGSVIERPVNKGKQHEMVDRVKHID